MGTNGRMMDDVTARMAGAAHRDAEPDAVDAASRYGTSDRTQRRWWNDGPPIARDFGSYVMTCPKPFRILADVKTAAKVRHLEKMGNAELVEHFHDLRCQEKAIEGTDNANDCKRGMTMLDRAIDKERDAAVNEEEAACLRIFAARRMTEEEVFNG